MSEETSSNPGVDARRWIRISAGLLAIPPLLAFAGAIWPTWVPIPFVDPTLTAGSSTLLVVVGCGLLVVNGLFLAVAYSMVRSSEES